MVIKLTNNQLKILAILAMTLDHIGLYVLPEVTILRIIGRIAFPIFAYMLAEGCFHTRNRKKHLLTLTAFAAACQAFNLIALHSVYQCVLVTFLLAEILIYIADNAVRKKTTASYAVLLGAAATVYIITVLVPSVTKTDFEFDYGFFGVLMPVFVYIADKKSDKLTAAAVMLVCLSLVYGSIQWWSLTAMPVLALYNGKKGQLRIKNFFYFYYPLHLAVIYMISEMV